MKIQHDKELVSLKEMMLANSIQVDALAQLLIEKGLITEAPGDRIPLQGDHVRKEG